MQADITIDDWLKQLAAKQPTPGGGGVAALSAALGAALIGMVSIYTTGPKWAEREKQMKDVNSKAEKLRIQALKLMQSDEEAFTQVGAAYQLPKESDSEKANRAKAIQEALIGAAEPPKQVIELCIKLIPLLEALAKEGNSAVISDVAVAASLAKAGLESAAVNVEINRSLINDQDAVDSLGQTISSAEEASHQADKIRQQVEKRIQGK